MERYICDLSVVIIARNEEEMLAECIESVISALDYAVKKNALRTYEIILSDSASTDKTIDIAKKYPIKIVQLKPNWQLSAPAGRYIGSLHAKGRYVFFTDGDCITDKEWFVKALPHLMDEEVAGVDGYEREYVAKDNIFYKVLEEERLQNEKKQVTDAEFIGKGIFKRDILMKAGSYNPWLKGCEERDLSFRIRRQGYRLLRLPYPCVLHHWAKKSGELKYWTVVRTTIGWGMGDGGMLRYNLGNKQIVNDVMRRNFNFRMLMNYYSVPFLIELGLLNILSVLTEPSLYSLIAIVLDVALAGVLFAWKFREKDSWGAVIYRHFQGISYAFLKQAFLIMGFLKKTKHTKDYPTDAVVIS